MGLARILYPLAAALILGAAAPASAAGPASGAAAKPTVVEGAVSAEGGWQTAGPDGAVYQLAGGTRMRLSGGASIRFEQTLRLQLGAPGAPGIRTQTLRLRDGSLEIDMPADRTATAMLVRGPMRLSAVARGGSSVVRVADGGMVVAARTGSMLVGEGVDWRPFAAGQVKTFTPRAPAPTVRGLLGAPHFAGGTTLAVAPELGAAAVDVAWAPMSGAKAWAVRIVRSGPDGESVVARRRTSEARASFRLSPGDYQAELAAIDGDGIESTRVTRRALRVLGMQLPEGAVVRADGAIELARGQRVRLSESDGIEVCYGQGGYWAAAPRDLGLSRAEQTLYRLRLRGATDVAPLALAPRTLHADVELGPPSARWPADRITVAVRLRDGSGRNLEPKGITPKVTINLDPIDVRWTRAGRALRAEVPTPRGSGPWVVRVDVADSQGRRLTHDFLEVAESTRPRPRPAQSTAASEPRRTARR